MIKKLMFIAVLLFVNVHLFAQVINTLDAPRFAESIKDKPGAILIDVRTEAEFNGGHLEKATNWDWKNGDFKAKSVKLSKDQPILLYCLSGARSDLAAQYLKGEGYKNITVLQGGILKWRAHNLPEINNAADTKGMALADYEKLLKSDKLILVDFYADWCIPCMQMKPYLEKIARNKKATVELVRINIDENRGLAKTLGIAELPILRLYKNEQLIWEKRALATEEELLLQINKETR